MAIEGPLRELGIHDVFQLLDLSRKTGTLAVTSELRDNEGTVLFENGRVAGATIKSNPHRLGDLLLRSGKVTEAEVARARAMQEKDHDGRLLGDILLEMGAITAKELERQVRLQIEAVVFELLSWGEGFFRFEEGAVGAAVVTSLRISTESLLMEGARRIDEWSRIADRVPSLSVIPQLAPMQGDHASSLDLLPSEWEVLTMINGEYDLRAIAAYLARSEFETAKVVYGLVSTGVVELRVPSATKSSLSRIPTPSVPILAMAPARIAVPPATEPVDALERGFRSLRLGDFDGAITAWSQFLRTHPVAEWSERIRGGVDAATRLRDLLEVRRGG